MDSNLDDAWETVHNDVGEALLDVERTFMDVAGLRTNDTNLAYVHELAAATDDYLSAWRRLEAAHHRLVSFLGPRGTRRATHSASEKAAPLLMLFTFNVLVFV